MSERKENTRRRERSRTPAKPKVVPLEERYGRVPPELTGLDREELPFGDERDQLAAHGPDGDSSIAIEGADAAGVALSEPMDAIEELEQMTDEDLARAAEDD